MSRVFLSFLLNAYNTHAKRIRCPWPTPFRHTLSPNEWSFSFLHCDFIRNSESDMCDLFFWFLTSRHNSPSSHANVAHSTGRRSTSSRQKSRWVSEDEGQLNELVCLVEECFPLLRLHSMNFRLRELLYRYLTRYSSGRIIPCETEESQDNTVFIVLKVHLSVLHVQ